MSYELEGLGFSPFFRDQIAKINRPELTIARIAAEHRGRYQLWSELGECMGRKAGRLYYQASRRYWDQHDKVNPAVGDWVAVRWPKRKTSLAQVEHIFTRRTVFLRRAAGPLTEPQVVAANIDTVFVVCGLDGDFNLRRIERYLAQLADTGSQAALILSKADLVDDAEEVAKEVIEAGVEAKIHIVSSKDESSIAALRAYLGQGLTVAFVGSSGTGKSTLINALVGEELQKVAAVREYDDRGRHTTRHRQLVLLEDGGLLLDTPGMRELQLWSSEAAIDEAFEDVTALAERCRFRDCKHQNEPGCAILEAIEDDELLEERFLHYQQLIDEDREQKEKAAEAARRRAHRAKSGAFHRSLKRRKEK